MGLDVSAKGMTRKQGFHMSYGSFYAIRCAVVKAAYGSDMEEIYKKGYISGIDADYWNARCSEDLDLFLLHSDSDGHFTQQECRIVRDALKNVPISDEPFHPGWPGFETMREAVEHWVMMFDYCARRRVCLWFG